MATQYSDLSNIMHFLISKNALFWLRMTRDIDMKRQLTCNFNDLLRIYLTKSALRSTLSEYYCRLGSQ